MGYAPPKDTRQLIKRLENGLLDWRTNERTHKAHGLYLNAAHLSTISSP